MNKLLVIGGSGYVASLVLPALAAKHTVKVFDIKQPVNPPAGVTFFQGSVCDPSALREAADGADTLVYMVMANGNWELPTFTADSFDANVKGVYLALQAAAGAGITHAVYTSSMSVYDGDLYLRHFGDEEVTPDSHHVYGFTKLLGEECCRAACREWPLSVNALRLCLPMPEERWQEQVLAGKPTIKTSANDVARAILAAIAYRGNGFQPFMISGDYEQKLMNMSRAKLRLGWEPLARPTRSE